MNDLQKYIGKKVNLSVKTVDYQLGPNVMKINRYTLEDPEIVKELKSLADNVRIHLPQSVCTAEHNALRLNIYIDPDGVISSISYG